MSQSAVELSTQYSDLEWKTRVELAAAYRLVHYHGWTSQVYNHITARIPGTKELLINPFGHAYDEIRPDNLIRIDIDGNKPVPLHRDFDWFSGAAKRADARRASAGLAC